MPRYVVEVEGFTDKTGPREYNLALSRRRADAVVRYLVDKGVPLRRIHMIGLGATMAPMTDGNAMAQNTSESPKLTRKQQRRVIVRVYAPESTLSASGQKPANQ